MDSLYYYSSHWKTKKRKIKKIKNKETELKLRDEQKRVDIAYLASECSWEMQQKHVHVIFSREEKVWENGR